MPSGYRVIKQEYSVQESNLSSHGRTWFGLERLSDDGTTSLGSLYGVDTVNGRFSIGFNRGEGATAMLDVNGDVRFRSINAFSNREGDNHFVNTVVSSENGTLAHFPGSPITSGGLIHYRLTKKDGDPDKVIDYNTKIIAEENDVIVLSVRFDGANITSTNPNHSFLNFNCSVIKKILDFTQEETYFLTMDYPTDTETFSGPGTWDIVLSVHPKGQVMEVVQDINAVDTANVNPIK